MGREERDLGGSSVCSRKVCGGLGISCVSLEELDGRPIFPQDPHPQLQPHPGLLKLGLWKLPHYLESSSEHQSPPLSPRSGEAILQQAENPTHGRPSGCRRQGQEQLGVEGFLPAPGPGLWATRDTMESRGWGQVGGKEGPEALLRWLGTWQSTLLPRPPGLPFWLFPWPCFWPTLVINALMETCKRFHMSL